MESGCVYELPLDERVRHLLRLESWFGQVRRGFHTDNYWESQLSLSALLEMLGMLARVDMRHECLQALGQAAARFEALQDNPLIAAKALERVIEAINQKQAALQAYSLSEAHLLREHPFLAGMSHRLAHAGHVTTVDIPSFHCWFHQGPAYRGRQLQDWLLAVAPLQEAIALLLGLLRESAALSLHCAVNGAFQHTFEHQSPQQLVRVIVSKSADMYPEISGDPHHLYVQFMQTPFEGEAAIPVEEDIDFRLGCCTLT